MPEKQQPKSQNGDLQQIAATLRDANNILVTIGTNPTVDQFASCIGLTLVLNKLGKHATAVFSGAIPSTIQFLKPDKTIEKNTDSLRDFIIALDKSKADKLRYKVEDNVVKIFITPYKTSINEDDLKFSQGDFNVDAVVALGIHDKKHIDQAILAHGRILHDATVVSVNNQSGGHIGTVDWTDNSSSSLCEMITDVVQSLSDSVFDEQNATALLTGIVAETDRYSNEKATPHTMSVAGILMSAGASTQLVSNELDSDLKAQTLPPLSDNNSNNDEIPSSEDGELDIDHSTDKQEDKDKENTETTPDDSDKVLEDLNLTDDHESDSTEEKEDSNDNNEEQPKESPEKPEGKTSTSRLIKDPPHFSGKLTANSEPEEAYYSGSTDPLSNMPESSALYSKQKQQLGSETTTSDADKKNLEGTLKDIEESVESPHVAEANSEEGQKPEPTNPVSEPTPASEVAQLSVDEARRAAAEASVDSSEPAEPREDIGSSNLGDNLNSQQNDSAEDNADAETAKASTPPPPVPPPLSPPLT